MTAQPPKSLLAAALAAAQGELQDPERTKRGQVRGRGDYRYAGLDDLLRAIRPVLSRHEIALTQRQERREGETYLVSELRHSSGEVIESSWRLTCAGTPQERGSELTYARRYTLEGLVGVAPTEEDDDGAAASQPKPEPRKAPAAAPAPDADYDRTLHDVCDQLVADGWDRETLRASLRDFAAFLGIDRDPFAVPADRLAKLPGWVAANSTFEIRWEKWWATVDELLEEHGLTRADLSAWCVSIQRPEPATMNEDGRGKLLAYLMSGDGLERLVRHAEQAKRGAA